MNSLTTQPSEFSREQIELIKRTVAPNTTDSELALFLHAARKYGLDPLLKEIWCVKYNSSVSIFTSRDGYLKIAHRSGMLDGISSYTIDDEMGNPVKAVCEVWRKDMSRPFRAEVKFKEYFNPNNPTWRKYPSAMLIKVAEVFALRRAFCISGLSSAEERLVEEHDYKPTHESTSAPTSESSPESTPASTPASTSTHESTSAPTSESSPESTPAPASASVASTEAALKAALTQEEIAAAKAIIQRFHFDKRKKATYMFDLLSARQVRKLINNPPFVSQEQKERLLNAMTERGVSMSKLQSYLGEAYDIYNIDDITTDIVDEVMNFVLKQDVIH